MKKKTRLKKALRVVEILKAVDADRIGTIKAPLRQVAKLLRYYR